METLIEFVRYTKGWEYIIAISCILCFILFWQFLATEQAIKVRMQAEETAMPLRQSYQAGAGQPVLSSNLSIKKSACWEVKICTVNNRNSCPAFLHPEVACWQAKKIVNGWKSIGRACAECSLYASPAAV